MKKLALSVVFFALFAGGCAVVPAQIVTVPQAAGGTVQVPPVVPMYIVPPVYYYPPIYYPFWVPIYGEHHHHRHRR